LEEGGRRAFSSKKKLLQIEGGEKVRRKLGKRITQQEKKRNQFFIRDDGKTYPRENEPQGAKGKTWKKSASE